MFPLLWQRKIMLPFLIIPFQRIQNYLQMFLITQKIRLARINKQRLQILLFNVAGVRFLDVEQIFIRNVLLVRPFSFAGIAV